MDTKSKGFSPPYNVPWATFLSSVEKIASDLPNKVDRSYLGSMSGGLKSYLISAFRGFGLVHDDLTVSDELKALATEPDRRPEMIGGLLRKFYPQAIELGTTNSTPGELDAAFAQMFPSVGGESRTKAIRFYLSAAEFAGVSRSPLWKSPKAGATGPRRGRPKKDKGSGTNGSGDTPLTPPSGQSLRQFALPSGRTLTISIDGDVLALDRDERKFVMGIVDQIEEHVEKHPVPKKAPEAAPSDEADDPEEEEPES
jgi:hypothetical protein